MPSGKRRRRQRGAKHVAGSHRQIHVRAINREPIDNDKLAQALIMLAQQEQNVKREK